MQPYTPRRIWFAGIETYAGWQIKRYRICYGEAGFDPERFKSGVSGAFEDLPVPAVTDTRVGAGFLIEHQGRGVDYVVLGWWDRENELPLRVWVHEHGPVSDWRPAVGAESVCVWDLQVIWHEREAYVATVLDSTVANALEAYLARTDNWPRQTSADKL